MHGINLKPKCPECGNIVPIHLLGTQYVKVNNSENDYVRCACDSCGKEFWMSHLFGTVIRTMKVKEDDRTKESMTVFW